MAANTLQQLRGSSLRRPNSSEPPSFKDVSLGCERLAAGWCSQHICTPQLGSSRAEEPYTFLKSISYGSGMCWRGKARGKSGSSVAPTALTYKQGQGLRHKGGSRNPPADRRHQLTPIISHLSSKLRFTEGLIQGWAVAAGLGLGCRASRGSGGDAGHPAVVGCRLSTQPAEGEAMLGNKRLQGNGPPTAVSSGSCPGRSECPWNSHGLCMGSFPS